MKKHIFLVDDDVLMRRSLAFHLEQAGFTVNTSASAEDALNYLRLQSPDLVLLDIGLPGMDGLDALRRIKTRDSIPVIFLTARRRDLDEVLGLELGADDYITKPFDVDVLVAHIKAVLRRFEEIRRPSGKPQEPLIVGDLVIDPVSHECILKGRRIDLAPREFDLLQALALEPNRVISVNDLLNRVWGAEYNGQPEVVYVHIRWLREKIEVNPQQPERLITVRGIGYKLIPKEV